MSINYYTFCWAYLCLILINITGIGGNKMDMFFEDFHIGDEMVTPCRTITEMDVVQFAGLSGDYNMLHIMVGSKVEKECFQLLQTRLYQELPLL